MRIIGGEFKVNGDGRTSNIGSGCGNIHRYIAFGYWRTYSKIIGNRTELILVMGPTITFHPNIHTSNHNRADYREHAPHESTQGPQVGATGASAARTR